MADKTVAQKARVRDDAAVAVIAGAPKVIESLGLPATVTFVEPARATLVFLFVNDRDELEAQMPPAIEALAPGAALWVFFRKGGKAAGLGMTRDDVWALAERHGMRPLGLVGVDETWSAFRLKRG